MCSVQEFTGMRRVNEWTPTRYADKYVQGHTDLPQRLELGWVYTDGLSQVKTEKQIQQQRRKTTTTTTRKRKNKRKTKA